MSEDVTRNDQSLTLLNGHSKIVDSALILAVATAMAYVAGISLQYGSIMRLGLSPQLAALWPLEQALVVGGITLAAEGLIAMGIYWAIARYSDRIVSTSFDAKPAAWRVLAGMYALILVVAAIPYVVGRTSQVGTISPDVSGWTLREQGNLGGHELYSFIGHRDGFFIFRNKGADEIVMIEEGDVQVLSIEAARD